MHQYPWISLNILDNFWINYDKTLNMSAYEYVWQGFGDASGSKCPRVLKTARLYMQMLYRVPNMSEYGSVCLNNAWYASACFNVPLDVTQYARPWLNIAEFLENSLINCSDYARILNMSHHLLNMPVFLV